MTPEVYAANATKLTDKQERFIREYLIDGNAGRAAIRSGYSRRSAYEIGHQNLRKHQIRKRIEALQAIRNETVKVAAHKVLEEMCYLAFSDIREVRFTPDGNLDSRHAPETARAIAQLEIERTETKDGPRIRSKVRMYDKRQALVSLMLHCALSRKFGYRLRHLRRRVVDGRFLDLGGQTGGANRWVVRSDKEFFAGPR